MKNIIVSGASGIIGYGILKSLQGLKRYNLIGITIFDDSIANGFCNIFEKAPMTSDENYIDWLCEIIRKHQVDVIIPAIEQDVMKWNDERVKLEQTGVKILLNNSSLIRLCSDKWNFYKELHKTNPRLAIDSRVDGSFEELEQNFGLPFLLKPRRSYASKGIIKVDSKEIFDKNQHNLGPILMAQPIVGNDQEEYTVSAFFNHDNKLLCFIELKRKLSKDGFTEKAEVVKVACMQETIEKLAKVFKPIGPTNFQFRLDHGELKLLEINPRISSATSIRTAFGYNEAMMSVEYLLNGAVPKQPKILSGKAVRYTEDYIFYDSTSI